MKTKLEMAHDYLRDIVSNWEYDDSFDPVAEAWKYADAMQAAADERENKTNCDTNAKFDMYLEYDASINYPPDAWVMYKGEKRLAVSINVEKEWQPDWSKAPDDATAWEYLGHNSARWHTTTKGRYKFADLFGFGGTDMLILKRPK